MRILIADRSWVGRVLAERLAAAGNEVNLLLAGASERPDAAVVAMSHGCELEQVRALSRRLPETHLVVLARVAVPEIAQLEGLDIDGFSRDDLERGQAHGAAPTGAGAGSGAALPAEVRPGCFLPR